MNYERKYKIALDRAKEQLECSKVCDYKNADIASVIMKTMYNIFPELKESEDEKIRKALINVFATHKDYEIFFGVSVEDIVAWLKKQEASNPYSGVSFEFNGHTWGMCARDNGVEILVDRAIKERVSLDDKQQPPWGEENSDNKPTWELVREFIQKFGRMPEDEDELNCLVQYVIDNKNN